MNRQKKTPELAGYRGGKSNHSQTNSTTFPPSCEKQRLAILSYLQRGKRLTTLYARQEFGIMHPAARVMELRKVGYNIITHKCRELDSAGVRHSVAEYVLLNG